MGPPHRLPCRSRPWYRTASTTSAYLVIIPTRADTHIQNTAPGPPRVMAEATPAMLPTPTVLPRAVAMAWKGLTPPAGRSPRPRRLPQVSRQMVRHRRRGKNRLLTVSHPPRPSTSARVPGPHTQLPIRLNKPSMALPLFLCRANTKRTGIRLAASITIGARPGGYAKKRAKKSPCCWQQGGATDKNKRI